ncbi:MAG: lcb5 [Verrucomicrobiales bacterium]|nr:lcb5 [Verrucomicrobiales bacterium]
MTSPQPSVCIIFNPAAKGDRAKKFQVALSALEVGVALKPTWAPGAARSLAAEAVRQGFSTVVAAGGDGTLNEVVNGIADVPGGLARCKLGVLPLGTANVFALELKLPFNLKAAWKIILHGQETTIDLGHAVYRDLSGKTCERLFVQLGGAGVDSRAVDLVVPRLKQKFGATAYVIAGFKALTRKPPAITVSHDLGIARGAQLIVGNGRLFAGRFPFCPGADLRDGLLDVLLLPKLKIRLLADFIFLLAAGKWPESDRRTLFQTRHLRIESEDMEFLQLDGENVGTLPATITVRQRLLRVAVA